MTSELRPAVEVWRDARNAFDKPDDYPAAYKAAAAVIEADREAVRADVVAEICEWLRGNCMSGKWRILASEIEEKWGKPHD